MPDGLLRFEINSNLKFNSKVIMVLYFAVCIDVPLLYLNNKFFDSRTVIFDNFKNLTKYFYNKEKKTAYTKYILV